MMSNPGWQTVTIHILPNISRNKDNQIITFGQSLEYNTRNIFLKKLYTECDGKAISFSKKSKLSIPLDQYSKVLWSLFLLYGKLRIKTAGANELL